MSPGDLVQPGEYAGWEGEDCPHSPDERYSYQQGAVRLPRGERCDDGLSIQGTWSCGTYIVSQSVSQVVWQSVNKSVSHVRILSIRVVIGL